MSSNDGDIAELAAQAKRIAELEAALRDLADHWDALNGPKAHRLGCACGGSDDGIHSCATLEQAFENIRPILEKR